MRSYRDQTVMISHKIDARKQTRALDLPYEQRTVVRDEGMK